MPCQTPLFPSPASFSFVRAYILAQKCFVDVLDSIRTHYSSTKLAILQILSPPLLPTSFVGVCRSPVGLRRHSICIYEYKTTVLIQQLSSSLSIQCQLPLSPLPTLWKGHLSIYNHIIYLIAKMRPHISSNLSFLLQAYIDSHIIPRLWLYLDG
jgi:hypothetical protein